MSEKLTKLINDIIDMGKGLEAMKDMSGPEVRDRILNGVIQLQAAISKHLGGGWVSVEGRLPEGYGYCLIYQHDKDFPDECIEIAKRDLGEGWITDDGIYDRKPTHWQPLPKPPEKPVCEKCGGFKVVSETKRIETLLPHRPRGERAYYLRARVPCNCQKEKK